MEPVSEWVTARPTPCLAPFIDGYVGYRLTGFPAAVHRGLPSSHLTFIVSIGPGIDVVAQPDRHHSPASYRWVVGGLQASAALISHDGHQEGIAIELTPLGSRALFGLPTRELWNTAVECADLVGSPGRELWERLQELTRWPDRFAACDDVLARLAEPETIVAPELERAWQAIVRSGGTAPVSALSSSVWWSRQHLARRFSDEFGCGPKLAARLVRFERARTMLQATPSFISIAQVAAACGYYDQAHLNRDFAELAGCSPRAWLAEELPSCQDNSAAGV